MMGQMTNAAKRAAWELAARWGRFGGKAFGGKGLWGKALWGGNLWGKSFWGKFSIAAAALVAAGCGGGGIELPERPQGVYRQGDVVIFRGPISVQSVAELERVFDLSVRDFRVESTGGDVEAALNFAPKLRESGARMIVEGPCLSACANYWFTAAKTKTVRKGGVVGFHGGATSIVSLIEVERNARAELQRDARVLRACGGSVAGCAHYEELVRDAVNSASYLAEREKALLRNIGVSQALLIDPISVLLDSAPASWTDGRERGMWAPSYEVLEKRYGVGGIDEGAWYARTREDRERLTETSCAGCERTLFVWGG